MKNHRETIELTLMALPAALWFFFFAYLPLTGMVLAFTEYRFSADGFWASLFQSDWIGFKNFEWLFATPDGWLIVRNTVLYNLGFIALGLLLSVAFALMMSELRNKKAAKVYQTMMFLPYFLSWVIVSYFVYTFLNVDEGLLNQLAVALGGQPVAWYQTPEAWPFILVLCNLWKSIGYASVVYLAAIVGIDKELYEAAALDGAGRGRQITAITLPSLKPMMIILTVLALGGIFRSDFGLFYQVPRNSGPLFPVTGVLDTYIYNGLKHMGEIGMSTAAGLYQSVVGLVLILAANAVVRRVDSSNAVF